VKQARLDLAAQKDMSLMLVVVESSRPRRRRKAMRIASLLKAWRHHHQLSIRGAAERLGIPPSTLARIEKDGTMSSETLAVILRWQLEPETSC
jgi:DNA-binding XRE family transcriptional regulator